ncbi:hypothetical protein [Acanthopleuribacter pedis]|uniref:Uncharacterized protein n=1 Tax=Acanthopleuribacter pedis TaxID=442870 RepID=A0A8J7QJ98_9BACT|nr:hypothetical protein [Acanthopleuribacter pedis]MBO1319223.1 hypothetical protein [Acanthopleuribacter pedis]
MKPKRSTYMVQPQPLREDRSNHAMGWLPGEIAGKKRVWHSGGINGFTSGISYLPAINIRVIRFHNVENPEHGPTAIRILLRYQQFSREAC